MNSRPVLLLSLSLICTAAIMAQEPEQETKLEADDLVMTSTATETRGVCVGNVRLTGTNISISCDRLEIVASRTGDKDATVGEFNGFKFLLATGNVRLVQGDREATCGRAEVLPIEQKVVLYEDPVVIDHSSGTTTAGSRITLLRGERRLEVKNPRVTGPPIEDLGPNTDDALRPSTADPQN